MLWLALTFSLTPLTLTDTQELPEEPWVVSAEAAVARIEAGASVFDTRSAKSFAWSHVDGAVRVTWQEFSRKQGVHHGKLRSRGTLQTKLRALGVSNARDVVVVGDPKKGWGEEGRIVWMLRSLGHERAMLVDGGHAALAAAGATTKRGKARAPEAGDFTASTNGRYSTTRDALRARLDDENILVVDTRERREYDGKTPYGESRGGHVPGSVHIHFSELVGDDGEIVSDEELAERLEALGVSQDTTVVAYCTGGIRSAHFTAILRHNGYDALNYAGSMWEWAASDPETYPLEK